MKSNVKILVSTILVLALVAGCFAAMPLTANADNTNIGVASVLSVDKKAYDTFSEVKYTANNNNVNTNDISLVSDNNKKGDYPNGRWYISVTSEDMVGTIEVAYKISNKYYTGTVNINGAGEYKLGDASGNNGINSVKLGKFIAYVPQVEPVIVNLGFIGYYLYEGEVLSTSIHWQNLKKEGDMINWEAVDAAYTEWIAQGGLVPDRTLWQTSGYASFTFEDYAELGYGNFNDGQLENYYKTYYADPSYILIKTVDTPIVNLNFYAFLDNSWWYGLNYGEVHELGIEITPDWDAVYEAYATQENVTPDWFQADKVIGWQSSGIVSEYFEGARPTIVLTQEMFEQYCETTEDILVIVLDPVFDKDTKTTDPIFESAAVTKYNANLQDKNNNNFSFTVTVTLSDGTTYDVDHTENVKGGQKGNNTFDYADYQVYVAWNDDNKVTACYTSANAVQL